MNTTKLNMNLLTFKAEAGSCEVFYRGKRVLSVRANEDNTYRDVEHYTTEAQRLISEIKNNERPKTINHMLTIENELNPHAPEFKKANASETISINGKELKYQVKSVEVRPGQETGWYKTARHFEIDMNYGGRLLKTYFSKGSGLSADCPTLKEVLYSLCLDLKFYMDGEDEFFGKMKYSEAKKVEKKMLKMKSFFGDDFDEFFKIYGQEE